MDDGRLTAREKRAIKEAVKESIDELVVANSNGVLEFTSALADHWAGMIDAFDNFVIGNLSQDRPDLARAVIQARLGSVQRARDNLNSKVHDMEKRASALDVEKRASARDG